MKQHRIKMSNRRFRIIIISLMCVLLAFCIALNYLASVWSATLDVYLGKGQSHIVESADTAGLNLDYYDVQYDNDEDSLEAAIEVATQIAEEGQVLMKNQDSTLPLDPSAKITPFGYRYVEPIYGGTGSGNVDVTKDYVYTPEKALKEIFGENSVNSTVEDLLKSSVPSLIGESSITLADTTEDTTTSGFGGSSTDKYSIKEYDPAIYDTDEVKASCEGTVGLVFIGRFGGESDDLRTNEYADGTPHQLALSTYEQQMIDFAQEYCESVVVILNSSNQMELGELELDEEVDAVLWIGGPGGLGFKAMAEILCGEVNPSGRTADTYYADFTINPSLQNWGQYEYANSSEIDLTGQRDDTSYNPNYLEYEEGIYMGYRFYETAWYELEQTEEGNGDAWYNGWRSEEDGRGTGVVYPFGYGLSYTSYEQEITGISEQDGTIQVEVTVTNVGDVAGKDVVQIYYTAPYTDYDRENGVEKSYVNLIAFEKTEILEPGESQNISVSFARDDMSSYAYQHENADGTQGCYLLEAGDYTISCRKNAHELYAETGCEVVYTLEETVAFEGEELRSSDKDGQSVMNEDGSITEVAARSQYDDEAGYEAVNNKFENLNDYMTDETVTNLSRSDWGSEPGEGSFPTTPNVESTLVLNEGPVSDILVKVTDKEMSEEVIAEASVSTGGNNYDYENDPELGNVEGSKIYAEEEPTQGADNGLTAADLRGVDYYDPLWDDLLDQIDFDEDMDQIAQMLFNHSYNTAALDSVGFSEAKNFDGPVGLTKTMGAGAETTGAGACAWPSEVVVASTFNTELTEAQGRAIGEEAFQFESGDGIICNGWYAPGMDMHRSPFNGRNFEYYSEDPTLTGKMGAAVITGAASKGLVAYMKHFVLNDQELMQKVTYTWCTEQTLREIYLRPYEIAIKEATMTLEYTVDGQNESKVMHATMGIMTAHNHIGATWTGSSYNLLTEVVRNEWGFLGCIVTDNATGYATSFDRMVRSGNDMWMGANMGNACAYDTESATARTAMRNAIHNILYTYVNSNLMQGMAAGSTVYYDMSPWQMALYGFDAVVALLLLLGVAWMILRSRSARKDPQCYAGTAEGELLLAKDAEAQRRLRIQLFVWIGIAVIFIIVAGFGISSLYQWYDALMHG